MNNKDSNPFAAIGILVVIAFCILFWLLVLSLPVLWIWGMLVGEIGLKDNIELGIAAVITFLIFCVTQIGE